MKGEITPSQIKKLVEHMIEIEPFMRSTMQQNDELEAFLAQNAVVDENIKRLSSDLKEVLGMEDEEESMMDDYIIAFNNMVKSNGYSMVSFLNGFSALAIFFQNSIHEIDNIYYQYLLYQKAQLTAELEELSVENPFNEDVATQAKAISKRPLVCTMLSPTKFRFSRQGAKRQKREVELDNTNYDEDESLKPA